ncbi:carnitine 3-dehydrogenase [Roseovarius spongiae]|uniref:L-carnitine dehydrogenase n=1 Tax=Roseovarius spongiae TaxID=2320272 RepID=A0A3A8AWH6_9RHOB|nr:carnitine 3-dehydrogenase [Roseovarius spongiae]RKF16087.1 carnitine 3-dehydrogenase [Roseovarius spongiae]
MTQTATIIGGGVIGGGWAARFLLNGWNVRVFDPDPEAERKIGEVLGNARHALPMLYDQALPAEGALTFHDRIDEAVEGAAWIQESVPERLDIKHKVFAEIQAACDAGAVIGSSTSGFKPSQLQEGASRPGQIMVCHPFNPVYLLPLIEVVGTEASDPALLDRASNLLRSVGLFPLRVRKEIDAHIADRFLEAVWREALWLIKDDIATTEEIDNAIRYGFGIRWAQMGLFETYRVAGGEAGMKHFIDQFGPALAWPWTKLMDVPELTDELAQKIADQSDAQSGHLSIRELERKRDNNLIAMMRALKQQGAAAGRLIAAHQKTLDLPPVEETPMITVRRTVPVDWTDRNGHMNEGRFGQIFSDAAEIVMDVAGAGEDYIAAGGSYFTVENTIKFLAEANAGEPVEVRTRVTDGEGKKLRCFHELVRTSDDTLLATSDQLMLHVDMKTRRTSLPTPEVAKRIAAFAAAHKE